MKIRPIITALTCLCTTLVGYSQFTDQINTNRPGKSAGAFSVGKNVYQLETGAFYLHNSHNILNYTTNGAGIDLSARGGFLLEQLELTLDTQFQTDQYTIGFITTNRSGFKNLTLGAKYLVYDPFKKAEDKPNIYSWKANHRFKWKQFIPAVALYGGVNYVPNNSYTITDESTINPKAMLIAQNKFGTRWVMVTNLIADKIGSLNSNFGYILTFTCGIDENWSAFAENRGIKGDYYSDGILTLGATRLFNNNLQVDASISKNFKNTPDIIYGGIGFSWRYAKKHTDPESKKGDKKTKKDKTKKGANAVKTPEELQKEQEKADKNNNNTSTLPISTQPTKKRVDNFETKDN